MEISNTNENSSINEKQRKLYLKLNSLVSSAENFETLKLYEDSLKLFTEASDLAKSLSKKQILVGSDDSHQMKNFLQYFENHIKSKIKILEQIVMIKNMSNNKSTTNRSKTSSSTDNIDISALSKYNNSSLPTKPDTNKLLTNNNLNTTSTVKDKEEFINTLTTLIKSCETNLIEIEEIKKTFSGNNNNTILLDTTIINQNSFYIPNIPKEDLMKFQITSNGNILKGSNTTIESSMILDKIEEKFHVIHMKLRRLKEYSDGEEVLKQRKIGKQEKLEKLKSTYSTMKKIYENAVRNGIKLK